MQLDRLINVSAGDSESGRGVRLVGGRVHEREHELRAQVEEGMQELADLTEDRGRHGVFPAGGPAGRDFRFQPRGEVGCGGPKGLPRSGGADVLRVVNEERNGHGHELSDLVRGEAPTEAGLGPVSDGVHVPIQRARGASRGQQVLLCLHGGDGREVFRHRARAGYLRLAKRAEDVCDGGLRDAVTFLLSAGRDQGECGDAGLVL